jgi:excisionase family DNA binding protein
MGEYLTTEEAIKELKIARSTLYEWIAQGKVKAYKIAGGRKNYFKRGELEALFQPAEQELKKESRLQNKDQQAA